jgi:hypothetical protein
MTAQPPHDLDAERIVLGALMSGAALADAGPLASADFYRPQHQMIYEAITALDASKSPCDPVAVGDELGQRGELSRMGGKPYLHTCMAACPVAASVGYYAQIVREHASKRQLGEIASRLHQMAADPGAEAGDARERALSELTALTRPGPGPGAARVVRLSEVEPERIDWLWPGYLPLGKLVVLDGDPDQGKSVITVDWAARITTGSPMPDGAVPAKGAVLILSAEDGLADTIRPRLDTAGSDPDQVITITEIGEGPAARPVTLPGDLAEIERVIIASGVILAVVDVLMAYLSGEVNSHRDQDVRRALRPLAAMAERTRCCVVVIRHLNKSGGQSAIYRGGGSIGIIGAARAGFMVGADPDDQSGETRVLAPIKTNLARRPPALAYRLTEDQDHHIVRVEWLGPSDRGAADLLADGEEREEQTERNEAVRWLIGYLDDHGGEAAPGDATQAAKLAGISERTLRRARHKAGVELSQAGFPAVSVWRHPAGHPTVRPQNGQSGQPSDLGQTDRTVAEQGELSEDSDDGGKVPPDW